MILFVPSGPQCEDTTCIIWVFG